MKRISKTEKIRKLLAEGKSVKDIAKKVGTSANYVYFVRWNAPDKKPAKKAKTVKKTAKKETPQWSVAANLKANEDLRQQLARFAEEDKQADAMEHALNGEPVQPDLFEEVNHPYHYTRGGIETIDFIEAKDLSYNLGNVVKYVSRSEFKGTRLKDLEKAKWYLNREIEAVNRLA